ncbi:antichymotrypsin-2 isoform X2 [Temnothorax americanus]|uniref:antichymotrypsin-2 isoform X2 n=1 Tax=Temnothorax americanus TaxID=1964332 RepID=UPI00406897ED
MTFRSDKFSLKTRKRDSFSRFICNVIFMHKLKEIKNFQILSNCNVQRVSNYIYICVNTALRIEEIHSLFAIVVGSTLALSDRDMSSSSGQQNDIKTLSTACNKFTIPLYKSLSTNVDSNVAISPLSLHIILSLLSNGAGGLTLNELKSALRHDDTAPLNDEFKFLALLLNNIENIELRIANKIYVQDGFDLMAEFLAICTDIFQSSISRLNFKDNGLAAKTINSWVRKATDNKIFDIISSETNLVPTMFKSSKYAYGDIPTWRTSFIEIPYLNQDIAMIILLPDREIELQVLENNFNWEVLADAPRSTDEVALYLPKFKFEITIDLKDALRKIGLNTMFEDNADFTRLSNVPLKVSHALQKIFIEINEEGSEAAAATVVGMRLKRMAILPMEFVVDRPFLFAIEHKPSRVPLFLGSVRNIEFVREKDEL